MGPEYDYITHNQAITYVQVAGSKTVLGHVERITARRYRWHLYAKPVALSTAIKAPRKDFAGAERTYRSRANALWALKHAHETRQQEPA